MRRWLKLLSVSAFVAALTGAASEAHALDYGHGGQFGLRAALTAGYRMVLRYDESPYCRDYDVTKPASDQAQFCGFPAPLALDLGLSFAPLDFVEPYLWARFGLAREKETNSKPLTLVGAGARLYTMSGSPLKIFVEPAVGLELEGGNGDPRFVNKTYRNDLVFHLAAGPQIDLASNVGLYADAGLNLGVLRALQSSLDLRIGVQGRFP
ncbi:MAG TPA: hypothetical protein VFQ61_27475 [Polyangiaceae bacterium]|nr:hypothetical protein [Polyangiaceae bacterium]